MAKKYFREELVKFKERLESNQNFAFSKFADGEFAIINNQTITNSDNWTYEKDEDRFYSEQLTEALKYKHEDHYVGITSKDVNLNEHQKLRSKSKQQENHLTFADLFVNSNHQYFTDEVVPLFSKRDIVLVCNKNNDVSHLPFNVYKKYEIGDKAWRDDYEMIYDIAFWIKDNNIEDKLFIFCAGPLGNMMVHRLHERFQNNTYLDVGSSLNGYFGLMNRRYLYNDKFKKRTPVW